MVEKIGRRIYLFEKWLVIILLAGIFGITFLQVVLRYVFNTGFSWVPEIAVFAFITATLVGCSTGVVNGVHVGVDVLVKKFSKGAQKFFVLFANFCGMVLYSFICYVCYQFVQYFREMGQVSIVTEIPIWIMIIYMPVAFAFTAFHYWELFWKTLHEKEVREKEVLLTRNL
ncbi:MAG: TRAP transporter small permease [Pseudomonadota bacterium]